MAQVAVVKVAARVRFLRLLVLHRQPVLVVEAVALLVPQQLPVHLRLPRKVVVDAAQLLLQRRQRSLVKASGGRPAHIIRWSSISRTTSCCLKPEEARIALPLPLRTRSAWFPINRFAMSWSPTRTPITLPVFQYWSPRVPRSSRTRTTRSFSKERSPHPERCCRRPTLL